MSEQTKSDQLDHIIKELSEGLADTVKAIESGIKTTQNNYGAYMSVLSQIGSDSDDHTKRIVAWALIEAGANQQGVKDAMRAHAIQF
jgi:hypothetical protein